MKSGYVRIKQFAKELGININGLLAMPPNNDPFYCGSKTQRIMAEWFADLWRQFGYTNGVHLRRVHYQLVSQPDPRLYNGKPYENTEGCWNHLLNAGKYARYLNFVDSQAFVDRRNPPPQIFMDDGEGERTPYAWIEEPDPWRLPSIPTDLAWRISFELPMARIKGYEYSRGDQPYHLEVWVEKSTMNDVLIPVCRQMGMNLVTGAGFQSITSVVAMLTRSEPRDKPLRIFYISDFDPAGDSMPASIARQVEFWRGKYDLEIEIKLQHLVLTHEQVETYQLPRTPAKESDRRKNGFEERYGEGAVELDALEALHPGTLARLVREAATPYVDKSLDERLMDAEWQAEKYAESAWDTALEPYRGELAELEAHAREIVEPYKENLERLNESLQNDLAPLKERLNSVWQAIKDMADEFDPELPERPEPEIILPDESHWLFDSNRTYLDQLTFYKNAKGVNE